MKNNKFLFMLYVLLGLFGNSQTICQTVYENYWIPNNTVFSTVRSGNTIYIGGAFTQIGPSTGCGTKIDLNTGNPDLAFAKVNCSVHASVPDGSGGWYIGGAFTMVGGIQRNMLAHISADGSVDENWNPYVTGDDPVIQAIAVYGSRVFVGGAFSGISGYSRNNLAAIDAESGAVLDWRCDSNYGVFTLAVSGSVLYAGGYFTSIGNPIQSRNYIASINVGDGSIRNWIPNANSWVYSIVTNGALVYVGGAFTKIGSQTPQPTRNRIAAIDATNGEATPWNPNADNTVVTLALSSSTIYAGGNFLFIGSQQPQRKYIAELNITNGQATNWIPNANSTVSVLLVSGSTVYVGGGFNNIGSQSPQPIRNYIAAINATTGEATDWNPNASDGILTLSFSGSNIYAGGEFFSVGGVQRNHLAAFDATTGMLTGWDPNVEGAVENPLGYPIGWVKKTANDDPSNPMSEFIEAGEILDPCIGTIAVSGSTVFVGGQFTSIGGVSRNNIAAINSTTGNVIENWDPNPDGGIGRILIADSLLFVSGNFTTIGNLSRDYIAKLDLETGNAIEDWNANSNYFVLDFVVSGSTIFTGGFFTSIGRQNRNRIAALDLITGNAIENWNPGANDGIYSLAIDGSILYVGGEFTYIGNTSRSRIAAIDAEYGRVTTWSPEASGDDPPPVIVKALAVTGNTVYAAGSFTTIGQRERTSIAALSMETGIATDWDPHPMYPNSPSPRGEVYAISVSSSGTTVFAGGFFSEIKDKMQSYFAGITGDGVTVVTNSLVNGWQTLSVPVVVDDFAKTSVWPTSNTNAYSFCGSGYQLQTILENGVGYWIGFPSEQDIFYAGEFLEQYETPVCTGWNIVGSVSEEAPISTNVCLYPEVNGFDSQFFIYRNGYHIATSILPGMGYWIKVKIDGSLYVDVNPVYCGNQESITEEGLDHFIVTDAEGKKQDLYVANLDLNPALQELDLSMPPPLPEVGFDARFSGDEYIKPVSPDSGEVELVIDVEAQAYPITLSWELNPENGITYSFIGDSGLGKISDIKSGFGKASFNQIRNNKIHLFASAQKTNNSVNHPTVYSLMQNYPNPFNPTTMIKYTLPKISDVALIIYDILGSKVATLVNEQQQPGSYEIKWDASNISSGIYFYQLKTKDYVDTKKMILLR